VKAVVGADNDVNDEDLHENDTVRRRIPAGVHVFEISGAFFFGAVESFKDTIAQVATTPRVLILRMRHVLVLDSSALKALRDVVRRSHAEGTLVLLSDVHMQPLVTLTGSQLLEELGRDKLFDDLDAALDYASRHIGFTPAASIVSSHDS
jgi:SulP family sulfate permease